MDQFVVPILVLIFIVSTFYSLVIFNQINDERAHKIKGKVSRISYFWLFLMVMAIGLMYEMNVMAFLFHNLFYTLLVTATLSAAVHSMLLWFASRRAM
ncbi:hypothetical protein [Alkalicoccus luteus]|uniref:hypothetical protein n=1 Tax=Alkalicoccus luteus TaxID=1237094 RepID=UPI00403394C2